MKMMKPLTFAMVGLCAAVFVCSCGDNKEELRERQEQEAQRMEKERKKQAKLAREEELFKARSARRAQMKVEQVMRERLKEREMNKNKQ